MTSSRADGQGRASGSFVTLGTVVVLLAGLAITLLGSGAANNALANYDASSWLWSSPKGEVARVNGVTGRVDTRVKLGDTQGHTMDVSQNDRYVILRDLNTGKISVLDLASLQVAATTDSTPGVGVSVALHDNTAFVIDAVQGLVRQLQPGTLAPVGDPLHFPPGLAGGTFDDSGRLWLLVPSEGTVVAIVPTAAGAQPGSGGADTSGHDTGGHDTGGPVSSGGTGGSGGAAGGSPHVAKTVPVAEPSHDLTLSVLDSGVAVLDKTAATLTTVRGDAKRTVPLSLPGPGAMPARTSGADVPVTVVDDRHVYVVTGDRVADFTVPGASPQLKPCVAWAGRFYCPDDATGAVYVLDLTGQPAGKITMTGTAGVLELEVREHHLFINAPKSPTARVVDDQHRVKVVDKYANNIIGSDPPPNPPPPPPTKPAVSAPSAPSKVVAVAGNAQVRLTWDPAQSNGAAIVKYVVEGGGRSIEVGASLRALNIAGLTNGSEYRFTVHAVNAKGAGPKRAANPVIPTADVPDPPASVNAQANPDGTVAVTWPAANGQGRKVLRYEVTAISAGTQAPAGQSGTPSLMIGAGKLTYGTQYAFSLVAVNDKGASSAVSPVSNTVVPYNRPGAPASVRATTVNQRGTVQVSWQAAADNGRAITRYVVAANSQPRDVVGATSVTLNGFADGATVQVSVRAVNTAGAGPPATATARTIAPPRLTLNPASATYTTLTVPFTVNDGGSPATCTLAVAGGGTSSGSCTSLTAGVWPGRTYTWTVTATNAAGSVSGPGSTATPSLLGTVICTVPSYCGPGAPNGGIWVYRTPSQNGTSVNDVFAPQRYDAVCKTTDSQGLTVNATPWGGKRSNMWVRIKFPAGQENYIPFAWFRLDSGDNLGLLPAC